MDSKLDHNQIKDIIRRRKKGFWVFFLLLFFTGLVVALALPPIYRSEAMIKVEDRDIKENLAQLTTNEYAEMRIVKINQKVLSRQNLGEIIEKFNLYSEGNKQETASQLIGKLRGDIQLETIVSEMQSKPGGRYRSFTTAFNLSFLGENPDTVQKVTERLANLYIEEDIKSTKKVVSATKDFHKAELERIKKDIEIQEKKISEFKEKHSRELPSDLSYNIQVVARQERQFDQANIQLRNLTQKRIYLESQLAQVEPLSPIVVEGERIAVNPNQRLKELNMQLTKLRSVYSDKHPDIKKLEKEISELESQVRYSDHSITKVKRLRQLENELVALEAKLGPRHPDVKALQKEIALLSHEVNNLMTETAKLKITEEKPDNPAYINLMTQLNAIKTEINAIREDKKNISRSIQIYQQRIEKAPEVEKELNALTRDYEAAKNKYNEVWNELTAAQVAQKIEGEQRGRRFSIESPAYLPTKAYKPNRLAIILLSFLIAIGTSSLFTALQESMDNSVRSTDQIKQITKVPVLSSVSYFVTNEEIRAKRNKKIIWGLVVLLAIGVILIVIDQFIISLDNLVLKLGQIWPIILERIKMIA